MEYQLTKEFGSLKNIKNNKKLDFYKIINIILIFSTIGGLILPWFVLPKLESNEFATTLTGIAGILRFLVGNKNQMITDIALHNFAIATFSFVLSFLSHGVLGCLFLFFNSFIMSMVLYGLRTFYAILFISLEFLGLCIATFGGTILAKKRKLDNLSMKNIFKSATILTLIMMCIYFLAAFIESNLIISKMR